MTILGLENRTIHRAAVATFACPSDPASGAPRAADSQIMAAHHLAAPGEQLPMVFTSYTGCYGSLLVNAIPRPDTGCVVPGQLQVQANGCLDEGPPIRAASIIDGLSQTLLLAERATTPLGWLDGSGSSVFSRYGWYITGNWGDTLTTTFFPPNMFRRVSQTAGARIAYGASSLHPGGLNVAMADGSVRFVKDTIQSWAFSPLTGIPTGARMTSGGWWTNLPAPGVWQALATRSGDETIDASSL